MKRRASALRIEEARLRTLFRTMVLATMSAPLGFLACSSAETVSPLDASADVSREASVDGTAPVDAPTGSDGTSSAEAAPEASPSNDAPADGVDEAAESGGGDAGDGGREGKDGAGRDAAEEDAGPPLFCKEPKVGPPIKIIEAFDGSVLCSYNRRMSCPTTSTPVGGSCLLGQNECNRLCNLLDAGTPLKCVYPTPYCTLAGQFVAEAGEPVEVECEYCVGAGRRPTGLVPRKASRRAPPAAAHFARAAHLEAASVVAFERMAGELARFGAPRGLVRGAERSARDEVRHARVMGALARRRGATVPAARVRPARPRSLERAALENAVEGCVRETYGALVATWQAARAADPGVREALATIAADETRHAALSWAVDRWAASRLDARANARLARARRRALEALRREVDVDVSPELTAAAGLPDRTRALALLDALSRELAA